MVQRKPKKVKTETSHKNPSIKVMMDKNRKNINQTINLSKKRYLNRLHSNNNGSKKELVQTVDNKIILPKTTKRKNPA